MDIRLAQKAYLSQETVMVIGLAQEATGNQAKSIVRVVNVIVDYADTVGIYFTLEKVLKKLTKK